MLGCDAIYYISKKIQDDLSVAFLKSAISKLLPLTKQKNTTIKFGAEISLASLLKFGNDQNRYQVSSHLIYTLLVCVLNIIQN